MERGESSGSDSCSDDIWAKLVPLDSSYSDIELKSNEVTICSEVKNSSSEKQEWCKIAREKDQVSALMQNKRNIHQLKVNATVAMFMRYMFKVMPTKETCKKQLKINLDPEHAKCSICLNVWHDVVTVAPCLHNFCNGCFSEWLKRCQDRHSSVLCPQCRAVVQFVGRNHFLHSIEEDILESDSSLRRPDEEIALLDSYSSIKSPLVVSNGRKLSRKRARAPPDEENVRDFPCPQCATEYAGFQCNQSTVHLQCQSCGGMMPSGPTNTNVPQHCNFSSILAPITFHVQQTPETLTPVSSSLLLLGDNGKMYQANGTIIAGCGFRMDKKDGQPRSSDCYDKLVSFLLYWFRITLPKHTVRGKSSPLGFVWTGCIRRSFYLQKQCSGKTAGTDTHVGHSTIMKSTLARGTMSVVQQGVLICLNAFTMT
ncbi:hypothetical protein Sango_1841100 [Sesamum angolense]|uniref:RING-type domain-containing protein n=1 Tax=Sesamum angolense TaxID=2727404 RepID=A0AAE1WI78_9LAMI|nr:hypothetical protein Sango_1841100 [Sesamum angolense]